jgi:glycosyltransferase involved in cell wall biosynthesis
VRKHEELMNILFNALIMTEKPFGYSSVISSYLDHMLTHIEATNRQDLRFFVVCQKRAVEQVDPSGRLRSSHLFTFIILPDLRNVLLRSLIEQVYLNYLAISHQCEVIHMPATLGLLFAVRKQVLFFHATTTFMLERKMHGRGPISTLLHNFVIRHSTQSADILAVSTQTTAEELLGYTRSRREYTVIGEGIKEITESTLPPQDEIVEKLQGQKFIMFTSSFYELKNQYLLIDLFKERKSSDLKLVLVGTNAQNDYYQKCLQEQNENIVILDRVTDATLNWLYRNTLLYVSPSLFEGFSMTPFEALKCGAPIILSDIPVHREVYGAGIKYFDPKSVSQLSNAVIEGLSNEYKMRCRLSLIDLEKRYSWESFLNKNLCLYEQAVGQVERASA